MGNPGAAMEGSYGTAFPRPLRSIKLWRRLSFPIARHPLVVMPAKAGIQ
jgi:hypothetical protein